MTRLQLILGLCILGGVLFLFFTLPKEAFQGDTTIAVKSNEITGFMTTASEVLCPAFKGILEDRMTDYEGTPSEKLEKAMVSLTKEAKGTLFPCPPPGDPLAVPSDIEDRTNRTITFVQTKLNEALTTIRESLDCKGAAQTTEGFSSPLLANLEAFQDVCTPQQLSDKQTVAKEEAAKAATQACIAPQDIPPQEKARMLEQRASALARVLGKQENAILLADIRTTYNELVSLKNRAQNGMISSSCPS